MSVDEDLRLVNVEVDEILAPGDEVRSLDLQPIAILQDFFEVEAETEVESLGALRVEVGVRHEAVDDAGGDRNLAERAGEGEHGQGGRAKSLAVDGEAHEPVRWHEAEGDGRQTDRGGGGGRGRKDR